MFEALNVNVMVQEIHESVKRTKKLLDLRSSTGVVVHEWNACRIDVADWAA